MTPFPYQNKISLTFHQLGNAIAVPHALLVLLMMVQSTTKAPIAINDLIQQLWHQRHKADSSVVLAGVEYWTLTKIDAYVRMLPTPSSPCNDQLFEALGATKVIVRNAQKTGSHLLHVPENWSVAQFLGQILQIDHNVFQHVTIANECNVFAKQSTIQDIAHTRLECIVKMKNMPVVHLSFPFDVPKEEELPATIPFDLIEEVEECYPGIVSLQIPTFDQILESAIFARFLSILEAYYAETTVLTPSDAKQTVTVGITKGAFVTRIPIKHACQYEQIKSIATQLHPGCNEVRIIVPPVPFDEPHKHPIYMLQAEAPSPKHCHVFVQIQAASSEIHIAVLPEGIDANTKLRINSKLWKIVYHNAARVKDHKALHFKNADIIVIAACEGHGSCIRVGGHPSALQKPQHPAIVNFASRCEYASNTSGWLATDELHFMMKKLAAKAPKAPAYVGTVVWNHETNELCEIDAAPLRPIQEGRTNLPVLWDAHWFGIELTVGPKFTRAILIGFLDEQQEDIKRALARFLDLQPHHLRLDVLCGPTTPNMCGWQLLDRWYKASEAHLSWTHQHHKLGDIAPARQAMINDVISDSHEEWSRSTQDGELKTFAELLRRDFFIHRALQPDPVDAIWEDISPVMSDEDVEPIALTMRMPTDDIEEHLAFMMQHPVWLCTDECDTLLDLVRAADPETYYPPPARWNSSTREFVTWTSKSLPLAFFDKIIWFVIIDEHWITIEVTKDGSRRQVFIDGLPENRIHYRTIADTLAGLCQTPPEHVRLSHYSTIPEYGMCGWYALFRIFDRAHVQMHKTRADVEQIFAACKQASAITKLRNHTDARWIDYSYPQLAEFCQVARDFFLLRLLEGKGAKAYSHAGAPTKEDAVMKEEKSRQAVQDPLFLNDPWARRLPRPQSTRWEDLRLPTEHPFVNAAGSKIDQTHRLQLQAKPQGLILATKQHLADISKTPGLEDLAVLLPAADKSTFGDAAMHLSGPHEVILEDPTLKTTYKRLVVMFVVRGTVNIKHSEPDCKCTAADYVEIVAELDSRILAASDFAQAKTEPMQTVRRLIIAIVPDISEQITLYGLRHYKPHANGKDTESLQVICPTMQKFRVQLLLGSGCHGVILRDFVDGPITKPDTTVLPKFWTPSVPDLHAMLISTADVPGAAGVAMTRRGLALRVWTAHIAAARKMLLHNDPRLTDQNRHVVPTVQFESSGWPSMIDVANVIEAVDAATSLPPVPTRAYRTAGVHCWTLSFASPPTKTKFTVEVAGSVHEILLVPATSRFNPKASNKSNNRQGRKAKTAKPHETPLQEPVQVVTKQTKEDQSRLDKLESKVSELESRQDKFERKFDQRLDGVDSALRQLLQRSEPVRPRDAGETPPPKFPRMVEMLGVRPIRGFWTFSVTFCFPLGFSLSFLLGRFPHLTTVTLLGSLVFRLLRIHLCTHTLTCAFWLIPLALTSLGSWISLCLDHGLLDVVHGSLLHPCCPSFPV